MLSHKLWMREKRNLVLQPYSADPHSSLCCFLTSSGALLSAALSWERSRGRCLQWILLKRLWFFEDFFSACLLKDGFFVPLTSGESYCAENLSRGKLTRAEWSPVEGRLGSEWVLGDTEWVQELKKRHLWKKDSILQIHLWFLTKPHSYHSCSLKQSHAMWSHLSAAFLYF